MPSHRPPSVQRSKRREAKPPSGIRGRLQLDRNGSTFLAPARMDLLEAVGQHGSITRAAQVLGLSYKAAWDAIDAMNDHAEVPLVTRSPGGSRGGGTTLTAYGKRVLNLVRRLERDYASVLSLLDHPSRDRADCRRENRQLALRTSARNQWIGPVTQVTLGLVRAQVRIAIGPHLSVCADVSAQSVERLAISPGVDVCALVKATSVELTRADAAEPAPVAHNQLPAQVVKIAQGSDQVEVTALLQDERSLTAVVPASAATRSLECGTRVVASFGPEQVLLVQIG